MRDPHDAGSHPSGQLPESRRIAKSIAGIRAVESPPLDEPSSTHEANTKAHGTAERPDEPEAGHRTGAECGEVEQLAVDSADATGGVHDQDHRDSPGVAAWRRIRRRG